MLMSLDSMLILLAQAATEPQTHSYRLLVFYLVMALGVSFLCSLLEAATLSLPRPHIEVILREHPILGQRLKDMVANIDRPLAAILTLNTVANVVGSAGVGAEVLVIYGSKWVALASALMTFLILVFSEIIPKTLGAAHTKALAPFTAVAVSAMIFVTYPVVILLQAISKRLGGASHHITREELHAIADLGLEGGALQADESRIIQNLLRLREVKVEDVMTPRSVAFMLPADTTVGEVLSQYGSVRFNRIPIFGENQDDILGIVQRHILHHAANEGKRDATLKSLARPIHAIPAVASVTQAFHEFLRQQNHLFLVVDEFGGTAGIITLEDAVETVLGVEIVDETDTVEDMRELAKQQMENRRRLREDQISS